MITQGVTFFLYAFFLITFIWCFVNGDLAPDDEITLGRVLFFISAVFLLAWQYLVGLITTIAWCVQLFT